MFKHSGNQAVLDTLAALVQINSVNPNYAGGVNELQIAEYIEGFFGEYGVATYRQKVYPGRPNLIAIIPGTDASRRLIFEAHTDTVSVAGMSIAPWQADIRDGKLYGRGACDTKGGLAAMMHAVRSLAEERVRPPCDVWLAATIDEEFSYRGVAALCSGEPAWGDQRGGLQATAAIIAEPTDLRPVIASKGVVRWKIETLGRAAHSAKPHLGLNAIEAMAHVVLAVQADSRQLADHPHPLLGPATCNVGVIRGGVQVNFVPDRCEIELDRRLLPGETPTTVLAHYQQLLEAVAARHPGLKFHMHSPMLTDIPLETAADAEPVLRMIEVLDQLELDSTPIGVPFGSDASKFGARGIPSMILGPGSIDQAHAAVEYVDVSQVLQAVDIYRNFIFAFE